MGISTPFGQLSRTWRQMFFCIYCSCISTEITAQSCSTFINNFPYTENFDDSPGSWVAGGTNSDWEWGSPSKPLIAGGAELSAKCWITGGLTKPTYNDNEDSWLISPCFDFTNLKEPEIDFWIFWNTERETDGATLQYSTDGGVTWSFVGEYSRLNSNCEKTNWFNGRELFRLGGVRGRAGNEFVYGGTCFGGDGSNGWKKAKHILHHLEGEPSIIFRFRFASGNVCTDYAGFAIDQMRIRTSPGQSVAFTYRCETDNKIAFSFDSFCALTYQWNFGDPASGASNMSSLVAPVHLFSGPGIFTVTLSATFQFGEPASTSQQIVVVGVNPVVEWPGACSNLPDATLKINAAGSPEPYSYSWNVTPVQTTPILTNVGTGQYTVTVSSLNTCDVVHTFDLKASSAITFHTQVNDAICNNNKGSVIPTITGGVAPYQYAWNNLSTNPTLLNQAAGNYSLVVTDAKGCTASGGPYTVNNIERQLTAVLGPDLFLCPGQAVTLSPGFFNNYRWQDGSTASTFSVTRSGRYYVNVTDKDGCAASDTINVLLDCKDIYFPTAFTPDFDGNNDAFGPMGNLPAITQYLLNIFDRYGNKIFYSSDPYEKWDGRYKEALPQTGSYVWMSEFTLENTKFFRKGSVTLIR